MSQMVWDRTSVSPWERGDSDASFKRLSTGKFGHWPSGDAASRPLEAHQLQVLLAGGDAESARSAPAWRPVNMAG
jgi:hypothetical protein